MIKLAGSLKYDFIALLLKKEIIIAELKNLFYMIKILLDYRRNLRNLKELSSLDISDLTLDEQKLKDSVSFIFH